MNRKAWNPLAEMGNLLDRYQLATGHRLLSNDDEQTFSEWSPTVDIKEDDDNYLIKADVPGVDQKDIDVRLDNGILSISGEKKEEKESGKGTKSHRTERFYGSFTRRFTLPTAIKVDKVDASYKDGVLSLKIPKSEEAKPKAIDIKVH